MSLFEGVDNVADLNKRIEGETHLEFVGIDYRNAKDPVKRMVIFKYAYVGPDDFFLNETVQEYFTFYRDMSEANLDSLPEKEADNARKAFKKMCDRLGDLGFTQDEINKKTADPEEKVGVVLRTNIYYNRGGYLQIGNAKLMQSKELDRPSDNGVSDLLGN